jgi:hypothetical protein
MKHEEKNLARRCEAMTNDEWYRKSRRCPNRRAIKINKKELCGRHAAIESLHVAFMNGNAVLLAQVPRRFSGVKTK